MYEREYIYYRLTIQVRVHRASILPEIYSLHVASANYMTSSDSNPSHRKYKKLCKQCNILLQYNISSLSEGTVNTTLCSTKSRKFKFSNILKRTLNVESVHSAPPSFSLKQYCIAASFSRIHLFATN